MSSERIIDSSPESHVRGAAALQSFYRCYSPHSVPLTILVMFATLTTKPSSRRRHRTSWSHWRRSNDFVLQATCLGCQEVEDFLEERRVNLMFSCESLDLRPQRIEPLLLHHGNATIAFVFGDAPAQLQPLG